MKTKDISLSETALSQLLQTIGCMNLPLLSISAGGARDYLNACREWEALGWGEPDFDGSFHPSILLARLVYTLRKTQGALRYDDEAGSVELFLRGPVDLIRLRKSADACEWKLAFCPLDSARRAFCDRLISAKNGVLSVQPTGETAARICLADTEAGSEDRMRAINDQLLCFYSKHASTGGSES